MKITPNHVRWFRLNRSGLVEPYSTTEEVAARVLGVQAQMPSAADLGFWNRTARCTQEGLQEARLEGRRLVRFWGQRNTLHIYQAKDWPLLHAAFSLRQSLMHQRLEKDGLLAEFKSVVRNYARRLAEGKALTYKDVKSRKLAAVQDRWVLSYLVFMELVRQGLACHGPDRGQQSTFVSRLHWLPDLAWAPPTPEGAFTELTRRYLSCYGPADAHDLAFWYGTNLTNARRWLESAREHCGEVEVGDRTLWCCKADVRELSRKPPPPSQWPVRLLPRFDVLVLGTRDKSWLIDEAHYKKVWRPSAHVEAVLLVRGRIAGTWRYERKARGLQVKVEPFAPLGRSVFRAAEKQAGAIADFLGVPLASFACS